MRRGRRVVTPYRSAEVRWFGRGEIPDAVEAWFAGLGEPVEAEARTDRYLAPTSDALGVKLREGQVETKRRDSVLGPLRVGASEAEVETWTKWSFTLAGAVPGGVAEAAGDFGDGWIAVAKSRRQRYHGDAALELSRLEVAGQAWWSVCLEASGPDPAAALADAARQWLASAPPWPETQACGYPAWLRAR